MWLKGAVAVAQENTDGARAVVRHSQVRFAVAIEVPDRDRNRTNSGGILRGHDKYSGLSYCVNSH
jgi:hypothetical protein